MAPQKVLIVSPQPWAHIPVSKHNYALVLARRGHQVVFLEPPRDGTTVEVDCRSVEGSGELRVLSYRRPWFHRLRFHLPVVFDFLMQRQIGGILRTMGFIPDLVWCFDMNQFGNPGSLGGARTIYHPVDPLSELRHIQPARTADLVLTVSQRIADQLSPARRPVHVINHGLAEPFERLALERLNDVKALSPKSGTRESDRRVQIGYAGNLCRRPMNRGVLQEIVAGHPDVDFHFWGPVDTDAEFATSFIRFLKSQRHVSLHGAVSQTDLATAYRDMDAFLLSYSADPRESDRSNSHKILEYLSTGKVTVTSRIQAYENSPGLLVMSETPSDDDLPGLFADTLARLAEWNSAERQAARILHALENTYDRQIDRIFQLLNAAGVAA